MEIFISWSGPLSKNIATKLKTWFGSFFGSKVKFFLSTKDIESGSRWEIELSKALERINYGIIVLTDDNVNKPWILFEAGAISKNIEDTRLYPMLFNIEKIDSPLSQFQWIPFEKEKFLQFLTDINKGIKSKSETEKRNPLDSFNRKWNSFEKKIKKIINDYMEQKGGSVREQGHFDLSPSKVFQVLYQAGIPPSTTKVFPDRKIAIEHIPPNLRQFLDNYLNTRYKKRIHQNGYEKTHFLINKTRISTFLSFTDGQRLLLFDREKGKYLTTVSNPCRDVFGSIDFENYSIFDKIKNPDFFKCITKDISLIPGFVFEDNSTAENSDIETVIMFGYHVYLETKDLEKGCNASSDLVQIFDISNKPSKQFLLTAKASHAIESLIDLKSHGNE